MESGESGTSGASTVLSAAKQKSGTAIVFLMFPDDSSTEAEYETLKKDAAPQGGGQTVDSATYNRYIVTNGELYYNIIRMNDTIIDAKANATDKSEVDNFIKAIKY